MEIINAPLGKGLVNLAETTCAADLQIGVEWEKEFNNFGVHIISIVWLGRLCNNVW